MSAKILPKIVLVTGASSGFGLFTAVRLAQAGHIVYASMRDLSRKFELEEVALRRGVSVNICELDVTKTDTITALINEIIKTHQRIDVVINNAGIALGGFFEDLDTLEMQRVMDVNFWGMVHVCREVVPMMRERRRGMIINVSSIAGQTASPALSAYHSSKWAMEGFSESLYHELKRFGVHVVLVEPGSYPTKIFGSNALTGKRSHDLKSPYYAVSVKLESFVRKFHDSNRRNPEDVAVLIERIVHNPHPRLRYVSDFQSLMRVLASKIIPPSLYHRIYEKVIYGNSKDPV